MMMLRFNVSFTFYYILYCYYYFRPVTNFFYSFQLFSFYSCFPSLRKAYIALWGKDQLRQKMAYSLSQILVISPDTGCADCTENYLSYYDMYVVCIIDIESLHYTALRTHKDNNITFFHVY